MYLLAPFILQNFKKILRADPELWGCTIFGPKMVHLPQTKLFLENYWCHSHLPISSFHWAKLLKNSSSGSRVMRMCNFWAQNGPFPQMRIFSENLLMSLVSFIHAYLHAKNQSQILIYQWNIDNWRILKSLWPRAIFGYNLRTIFFPCMQFLQNVNEP